MATVLSSHRWLQPIHWPEKSRMRKVESHEDLSAGVALLTALSTKQRHKDGPSAQIQCLRTWQSLGCRIIVQNTSEEIDYLKPYFPMVHEWVECNEQSTHYPDFKSQLMINLAKTAIERDAAIINSDIEILSTQSDIKQMMSRDDQHFVMGIRWNYANSPMQATEFRWGLDLLAISPNQFSVLPRDMPYAIGQPMWDYAIPEILIRAGYKIKLTHKPILYHRDHEQHWSADSHKMGMDWLSHFTGEQFDDKRFRDRLEPGWRYDEHSGRYTETRNHWIPLHQYGPEHRDNWDATEAKRWYETVWLPAVPQINCQCRRHWRELTKQYPPDFSSAFSFFEWGWARHDDVSKLHSHRPRISLEEAKVIFWYEQPVVCSPQQD